MKVTLPSAQSRLAMPPQRATNPFRQPRRSVTSPHNSAQWPGPKLNMLPGGYNHQPMGRPAHISGQPYSPVYMNNEMKGGGPGHPASMRQPDIANQCVPNENLTPDQRQRRESSLASLRKIHQMLLADDGNSMTDFSHINMAQDRHGPYPGASPGHPTGNFNNFGMNPPTTGPGSMYAPGMPMSPAGAPVGAMEPKPPPPYPMPSPAPAPQPTTKKSSRKRKSSVARSPAPASPLEMAAVKTEKHPFPRSPLATQPMDTGLPQSSQPGGKLTAPKPPSHIVMANAEDTKTMPHPALGRHSSLPNFPAGRGGGPQAASYRMLQAGQPTLYQVTLSSTCYESLPASDCLQKVYFRLLPPADDTSSNITIVVCSQHYDTLVRGFSIAVVKL